MYARACSPTLQRNITSIFHTRVNASPLHFQSRNKSNDVRKTSRANFDRGINPSTKKYSQHRPSCSEDNSSVPSKRFNPPHSHAGWRRAGAAREYFNALFRGRENKRWEEEDESKKVKESGRNAPAKAGKLKFQSSVFSPVGFTLFRHGVALFSSVMNGRYTCYGLYFT